MSAHLMTDMLRMVKLPARQEVRTSKGRLIAGSRLYSRGSSVGLEQPIARYRDIYQGSPDRVITWQNWEFQPPSMDSF